MKTLRGLTPDSRITIKARSGKPATFTALVYTGRQLNINGWEHPVIVDLAGLRPGATVVANLDHKATQRVGIVDRVDNDGRRLIAYGNCNAASKACKEVVASAKRGYRWEASIEVSPKKIEELPKGKIVEVNGRQQVGPALITRTGILKGFAFVTHGADDETHANIAAVGSLAAQVAALSPDLKRAVLGVASLATLEQLLGTDGRTLKTQLADLEPQAIGGVSHYSVADVLTTILKGKK